ncbi:unnamed protein product [Rotaria sp. Silwood1]|nr:unnamed protein product [Rotaria sp. Silwood1]CAF0909554.1 unnamed protein product [Rotaria sp. Silwood1]CAF3392492.1 unnamed protein product [Rotaria sp. Silwood1]
MSLIQCYSIALSSIAGANHLIQDDNTLIAQILNDVATIKQQDIDEKRYFHTLNDRLEDLLHYLDDLELGNKNLCNNLNLLIANWGIVEESHAQFLHELDNLLQYLSEQNRRKISVQIETKIFDEQIQLTDRIQSIFLDVLNSYNEKHDILHDLINQLENESDKIQLRLDISNNLIKSHVDDYQKELTRFRFYLSEWSQMTLDKQNLLNEIQSLKEHYNLRLGYNQEEINEWKRLLNRLTQDSKNFYQDSLEIIKQQLQIDYEQMLKEQQMDVEIELITQLKEIQNKIHMNLSIDENDKQRHRERTQHFENRLQENTKEYDRLESDYRRLTEEIQHKRQILQDLENQAKTKALKYAEQHARLGHDTDLIRAEYYALKDELDKLVYTLRFNIEEELKIYEVLLNSLDRGKDVHSSLNKLTHSQLSKTSMTRTIDIDHSSKYQSPLTSRDIISTTFDKSGIEQNTINQNQKMTTQTTQSFLHEMDEQQMNISTNKNEQHMSERDEEYVQSITHVKRKYKGKIRIKSVDIQGYFVEVENISNQPHDLTGWYIERTVDGRRMNYAFPAFELDSHKTVRIYGNYDQQSSISMTDDSYLQLIAPNFYDWNTGQQMRTELFNRDDIIKALFEQIIDD